MVPSPANRQEPQGNTGAGGAQGMGAWRPAQNSGRTASSTHTGTWRPATGCLGRLATGTTETAALAPSSREPRAPSAGTAGNSNTAHRSWRPATGSLGRLAGTTKQNTELAPSSKEPRAPSRNSSRIPKQHREQLAPSTRAPRAPYSKATEHSHTWRQAPGRLGLLRQQQNFRKWQTQQQGASQGALGALAPSSQNTATTWRPVTGIQGRLADSTEFQQHGQAPGAQQQTATQQHRFLAPCTWAPWAPAHIHKQTPIFQVLHIQYT